MKLKKKVNAEKQEMKLYKLRRFRRGESDEDDSDEERQREIELFSAIGKGKLEEVKKLLESGLKTDIINRNNKDNTPLHYAVEKSKKEIVDELLVEHWKTDIDAKNRKGDTSLHIASSKGNKELVKLLLDKGARTGIKNLKGNTALELAKDEEIKAIISAKSETVVESSKKQQDRKRKEPEPDDELIKRLKILQGTKRPAEDETDNDRKQKLKTSGGYSASGLKTSLHGTVYQLKLLMLFMKRGLDLGYKFRLATEMDAAEKMDDLVFRYEEGGKQVFRFLQAKHKQNEDKKISVNDFLTETEGEFSLQKYFTTFRSIKNNPMFNGVNEEIRDLILCTNIDYDHDGKKGNLELKQVFDKVRDEKGNEKIDDILKTVLIKFKDDFNGKGQIVSVLENSSELIKLAKVLADCVLDGKKIDNDKSKNEAGENLFVSYQLPLIDEVIDISSKKLKDDFIKGMKLSEEGENLRNAFEKVFDDRRKSYNIDDNPFIRNEDLGNLAQEIATLMAKDKGSKPVKILRNKNVIKNNIDKFAGYVIVIKDGKKQFSSGFIKNNQLPGNLDIFRNRLRIELSKKNIPFNSLNNYNFEVNNLKTCEEVYVDKNGFWDEIKDRKLKLFDEFGKKNVDLMPLDKFVDKLARLINESNFRGDEYVVIERKDQIISKNIDKLGKHVLIEENGKIRFSDEFLRGSNLPGNLDQFRTQLMAKVNDPNDLDKCIFEIGNFPKLNLPNDSIADINNDIKSYFDHLVLALKQPSEIALDKIIREEMGKDEEINLIDSDFLASQFLKQILDWMKEKEGRFLDYKDGLKFFNDMKIKLASLVLTCPSLEYRSKFEELNIEFNGVETELKNFLDPYNKNQIFNFISPPDTVLGSIKVYQTLKSIPAYKQDDSYIFIRLNSFLRIQDRVANAFNSQSKRLLIIECKPREETVQESYEELFKVIASNKKIVLITEEDNMLSKLFKMMFGSKYVEKSIEVNSLLDLTYESQNKIMNEGKVIFQGEEIVLGELINVESMKYIDAGALSSLINKKRLEIAKPLQKLDDVKDYYVPRTFNRRVKIYDFFQEDTSRFYVTYDSQFSARDLNNNHDIILIADKSRDFKELCDLYKMHNNHWLKKLNNEFIWQKSEGTLSKIRRLVKRSRDNVTPYKPEKVSDIADKIVIVAAEPGMGKSTVLTNLAVETKAYEPTMWVAKINLLVDCSTELESLVNHRIRFNDGKTVEFLQKIIKLDRELDRELFKDFYKRGNMVLLFDGFDEISPHYKSKVIELLTFLKSTKIAKIWVTTRPYNIRDDLEDALSSFSYTLQEFSDVEQRIFLQKLWNKNLNFDNQLDEIRANIFIGELLDKFTKSINDRERKFVSIPLQLKMIADVFMDTFNEFYNSNNDELSDEHKRQFDKNLDMISLYKRFFNVKFDDILFGEKSSGLIKADVKFRDMIDDKREKVKSDHKELALYSLYRKSDVERLLSRERDQNLFENIKDSKDKTGIIDRVTERRPIFVHQTFAEYFAAVWFTENWRTDAVNEFLSKRFYTEKNEVTRNFFDRILARDDDNVYEMHDAALNNNEVKIENLLQNNGWAFKTFDKAERTPLHLAASYGFENIVERLLKAASQKHESEIMLNVKDKLFNWSPLSYADRAGHWNVAESLLKNGANGDEMFEAINSIKNGETNGRLESLLHIAAKEGYLEFAKFLLEKGADIYALETNDKTPLHLAAQKGRLNLVKYFVNDREVHLDLKDKYGKIPLHLAAENGHLDVVEYFVEDKGVKLDVKDRYGMVPLHLAAQEERLDVVKYFVGEKEMDVSIEDEDDQVPLHMAARNGHLETVKYLIKMDVNLKTVNKIASHGGTPLHMAARSGNLEVVEYLMKNGAEFEIVDDSTPLHWAALDGKLEVVKYFFEKENADIEAPEYDGSTLLHLAALDGHLEVAKYLVNERGANLEAFDNNGRIPLHLAARSGKIHVVEFLADQKSRTINFRDKNGETPSSLAADGFLDVLRYLVDVKNADINTKNDNDQNLFHKAASGPNALKVVQYLCEEKNVNFLDKDKEGSTALHLAARNGRSEVVDYFLERIEHSPGELGQILFDTEEYGMTPLHYAILNDHEEIVKALLDFMKNYPENLRALISNEESDLEDNSLTEKLLVEKSARILIRNKHHTILHESVLGNRKETIELIANIIITDHNKIFIDLPDTEGNTPLIWAAKNNKNNAAEVLLDKGADINAKNNQKKTALHLAIINRHESMVEFLIGKDANIELEDEIGRRALHWAAEEREWDIATILIAAKANVNAVDKESRAPLHWAAADGNLSMVELLTDNEADLVAKDKNGNTPLHFSAHGGELETLKYLVEDKGVDFYSPNDWGNTPLHLAAQEGKLTTVNYLLKRLDEDPQKLNELLFDIEKYGMTPLHYAALNAHGKVVDALLSRMRNSEEKLKSLIFDVEDETANDFDYDDNDSVVKLLLERGAELFLKNKRYTILHEAIRGNDEIVIKLILEKIKNERRNIINEPDNEGNTPLIWAVKRGKINAAEILLAHDAGLNIRNNDGQTALYWAAKNSYQDITQLLIDNGANPGIKDYEGRSPLSQTRNQEIASLLESHHGMGVEGISRDEERGLPSSGECPASEISSTSKARRRRKREAMIGECELEWEDVDAFNEEKEMLRNYKEIKIDSGKFINYIKSRSMSESKLNQLVKLADEVQVTGEYQSLVKKLTNNKYTMNHLTRMGKFAGITMHGMMGKNIVADFLNENYQGVAINIGFIAGGRGFAKLAETVNNEGSKLISEEKFLLGKSLKASSPFLSRGTTAFVVYDLINQLKLFNNGSDEAVVGVVGDGIFLGVDAAEIGVEVAEAFEALEGVSSVTGPIGAVIGAVVFVGTDIYTVVKKVEKIDALIDLSAREKFVEGLHAFIGMQPEKYIAELIEEKEMNNQLVKEGFEYLKHHGDIISYVFPTGKSVVDSCRIISYKTSVCSGGGLGGRCFNGDTITRYVKECKKKFKVDLESSVLFDKKRSNVKWGRAKPDRPISGGDLLCSPEGDYESVPNNEAYLCQNAIGVTATAKNKTGNYVLINLEEGEDYAKGFIDGPNIFLVKNGVKNYQGGDMNDTFLLLGDEIKGSLLGGGGVDTLDLSNFAPAATIVDFMFETGDIIYNRPNILRSFGVNRVLGRKKKADRIFAACDRYFDNIEFLDGQSGNKHFSDYINIEGKNCTHEIKIVLRPYTVIENGALNGNFSYIVPRGFGKSKIDFICSNESLSVNNNFIFEYELTEIGNISVKNLKSPYKNNSHLIEFYFSPNSDREYNVTISAANNPIYRFGNDAEMKVGNTGNLYMLQNSFDSVAEIIKRCFAVSNRLKKISFFIQSLSSNETVVIGSGNHEVIHNNPLYKSHLIGNAGENIYVIDSVNRVFEIDKLPLPEVVIYDLDSETSIDVIDLRNLVGQARASKRFSIENDFTELRVYKYGEDLLLKVNVIDNIETRNSTNTTREYFSIRLKQGIYWNNKTQIITNNILLKINLDEEIWSLKPVPLIFEKEKEIIIVDNRDVEANSELISPRKLGDYIFVKNNGIDLVITNAFSANITKNDLCTIVLSQFYEIPKMKSLSIKFPDKELILVDHCEEIYAAKDIDTVKKEYNHRIYKNVFDQVKSVNTSAKTASFHSSETRKRKSKHGRYKRKISSWCSENGRNSATRSAYSWINELFSWMTKKKNKFLTTSSVNINLLTGWFFGSKNAAMQLGEKEYCSSINEGDSKTGYFLQSIDFNGWILLTDVVLAKMGNRRLHTFLKRDEDFSELETLGHALRIRQEFEHAVEKAAIKCGIPAISLDFDFLQIQTEISKRLMSGRLTGIDLFLTSHVEKSLAGLSEKEIERFMRTVDGSSLSKLIYGSKADNIK